MANKDITHQQIIEYMTTLITEVRQDVYGLEFRLNVKIDQLDKKVDLINRSQIKYNRFLADNLVDQKKRIISLEKWRTSGATP